jgi:hypothetical protein
MNQKFKRQNTTEEFQAERAKKMKNIATKLWD